MLSQQIGGYAFHIFAFCSAWTFLCYHLIPWGVERLTDRRIPRVVRAGYFTWFIRTCGNDHLAMLAGMFLFNFADPSKHGAAAWLIVISSAMVAAISTIAVIQVILTIRKVGDT